MDLGPHAHFIIASYAIVGVVLAAMIAFLLYDGKRLQKRYADLEQRSPSKPQ